MRYYLFLAVIITIMMILIPAAALNNENKEQKSELVSVRDIDVKDTNDAIGVLMTSTNTILMLDKTEYLVGVVAAEMPATYHIEALKAQAIASNTYAEYIKKEDEKLFGADITDSPERHQAYLTKEERKAKWGDKFNEYENKIRSAVSEVQDTVITYNSEPIAASFFSMCPGQTENSEDVFGNVSPYLKSVNSDGDKLSPEYSKKINITVDEFKGKMMNNYSIDFTEDPSDWIEIEDKTDVGTVKSVKICDTTVSGEDFRKIFDLRSCAFSVKYSDERFTIKTEGYGHFVGMSQYGADYMARQGATCNEILTHYYTDVKISDE